MRPVSSSEDEMHGTWLFMCLRPWNGFIGQALLCEELHLRGFPSASRKSILPKSRLPIVPAGIVTDTIETAQDND
jgi:hypothetical protein